MDHLFDPENAFFSAVSRIMDLVLLSVLWAAVSIPVVTAGAASAGLYYAVTKSVRSQRSYPAREFFRGFRENFKKATAIWLCLIAIGIMFFFSDFPLAVSFLSGEKGADMLLLILFMLKALLFLGVSCLIFPLLSRFQGSVLRLFENTVRLIAGHPVRVILSVLLLCACLILVCAEVFFLALLPAAFVWLLSFLWEPVFCRMALQLEEGKAETDGMQGQKEENDRWYMELGDRGPQVSSEREN